MRVLTVRGCNLASLAGRFEIDLTAEPLAGVGLFAITGDTGSGKSTLLDALCLALYGAYPRVSVSRREDVPDASGQALSVSDPANILRRGTGRGWAEVDFVGIDGATYRARWEIYRARDRANGNLQNVQRTLVRIDDGSVIAGTIQSVKAEVVRLTALTFEQFRRTVLLAQGEFDAFLVADNAERGELLEKITGTEIYAEISKRVFADCNAYRAQRDRLRERMESLQLLTDEEKKALDDARGQLDQKIKEFEDASGNIERELQFRADVRRRRGELETAVNEHRQAQEAFSQAQPERDRLEKLRRVEPLRTIQEQLIQLHAQVPGMEAAVEAAEKALESALEADRSAAENFTQATQAQTEAEQACDTYAPEWRAAEGLDSRVTIAEKEVNASRDGCRQAEAALHEAQESLRKSRTDLSIEADRLTTVRTKLAKLDSVSPIADRLQEILTALDTRRDLRDELTKSEVGLAEATGKLATASNAEAVCSRDIVTQDEALQHLGEQVIQNEASLEAMDEAGLRRREKALHAVQDSLGKAIDLVKTAVLAESNERKATERRNRTQSSLTASLAKQSEIEAELETLEAERNAVEKAERTVSESADTLRSHLVDGEPCSVCGSSEHPYAHGGIAAFKRAAKGIRKQREALEKRIASANAELKKVASALGSAKATLEASSTSTSEARNVYKHSKQQYQLLVPTLSAQLTDVRIKAKISTVLNLNLLPALQAVADGATTEQRQLEQALRELMRKSTALANLRKKKEALTVIIRQAQLRERQLRREREQAKKEVHSVEINTNQRRTELGQKDAFLLPFLRAVQLNTEVLDSGMARARKQIESQAQAVINGRSDERSLLAGLEQFRELVATRSAERGAAQTQHEKQKVGYAKRIEECNAVRRERQLLLGGEATNVHRARFEFALKTARTTKEAAQDAATKATNKLIEHRQSRESMRAKLSSLQERIAESEVSFIAGYESASLSHEEARALLEASVAECKLLDIRIQSLDKRLQEAAKAEQLRHEDILRLGSAADKVSYEPKEDDPLQLQLDELSSSSRQCIEEIGSVRQKLATDDEGRAAAGTLREELLALETGLRSWEEVEEAIGSRLGDRFRIFAQSITLEHLVQLANRNLKSIGPRYQLAKGGENNLALHVVDCEMEAEHRSTRSLSGGERFLVSLALALALSALNGRQSFVDTLFIDEGFGALDSDSLDTAIGALEVIQSFGRKVGVITHVDGIKERLAVQVVVEKLGAGRSRVRLHPAIQG